LCTGAQKTAACPYIPCLPNLKSLSITGFCYGSNSPQPSATHSFPTCCALKSATSCIFLNNLLLGNQPGNAHLRPGSPAAASPACSKCWSSLPSQSAPSALLAQLARSPREANKAAMLASCAPRQ